MAECGITVDKEVTPMLRLLGDHGFADYYSNLEYFDPKFDRDFRNKKGIFVEFWLIVHFNFVKDDDNVYYRGGHVYFRPYGFMCYAIKVIFLITKI